MAAFTHLNPEGSRFSDGSWGVFYAAHSVATAVEETVYHRERFLAATARAGLRHADALLPDQPRRQAARHSRWLAGGP